MVKAFFYLRGSCARKADIRLAMEGPFEGLRV